MIPRLRFRPLRCIAVSAATVLLVGCTAHTAEMPEATPVADIDYQQQANDDWWSLWMIDYPDAVKPDVEVVREVTLSEWAPALADCMVSSGYPDTTPGPDGGVGISHAPEGQREAQLIALYVCHAQYPVAEKYLRPLTGHQLGALYDYWSGELTECLEARGFVSSDERPSRETFIQEADSVSWNPYNGLSDAVGEEEYAAIARDCPRYPDEIY